MLMLLTLVIHILSLLVYNVFNSLIPLCLRLLWSLVKYVLSVTGACCYHRALLGIMVPPPPRRVNGILYSQL